MESSATSEPQVDPEEFWNSAEYREEAIKQYAGYGAAAGCAALGAAAAAPVCAWAGSTVAGWAIDGFNALFGNDEAEYAKAHAAWFAREAQAEQLGKVQDARSQAILLELIEFRKSIGDADGLKALTTTTVARSLNAYGPPGRASLYTSTGHVAPEWDAWGQYLATQKAMNQDGWSQADASWKARTAGRAVFDDWEAAMKGALARYIPARTERAAERQAKLGLQSQSSVRTERAAERQAKLGLQSQSSVAPVVVAGVAVGSFLVWRLVFKG